MKRVKSALVWSMLSLFLLKTLKFLQLESYKFQKVKYAIKNNLLSKNQENLTLNLGKESSVQFSPLVVSNSLRPHESQHTRPPCPSPAPGTTSNSYPLSRWCHPTISSSVVPLSSCLQSFPEPGSFPMSQFFPSGSQSIGVSASNQSFQWIFRTDFL